MFKKTCKHSNCRPRQGASYNELKNSSPLDREKFDFLAGESLKISPEKLFLEALSLELTESQVNLIKKNEAQAIAGTPPQYIFKKAYFCENEFYVDENVLIPRPETELLVQEAKCFLDRIKNNELRIKKLRILDLGTGSGNIIISIYKILDSLFLLPNSTLYASDVSSPALKIAKQNAKKHKAKITFIKSNLFENISGKFDLICANLPYLDRADPDCPALADPMVALDGGKNGFELIKKTILELPHYLNKNGVAIFEIGYDQGKLVRETAKKAGFQCKVKKDLSDYMRVATIY